MSASKRIALAAGVVAAIAVPGCGDGSGPQAPAGVSQSVFERQLADAERPRTSDFPAVAGRSLEELAEEVTGGNEAPLATSVLVPGENRLGFGVLDPKQRFVYGKSAIYIARTPGSRAKGPFLAPADSLITEGRFRSRQAATEESPIAAIYAAQVPLQEPGRHFGLVVTKTARGLLGAPVEFTVTSDSPIPAVGERPPAIDTDTIASTGSKDAVDTRVPPAPELHQTNFKDVLGKRPVALLFATPQLCQSRVCGPVADIALQLKTKYGDKVEFIHQEVYVDNDLNKGLRKPLTDFNLQTEPWLFTFDREGRVAARLEGSFGLRAFDSAVRAALE